MFYLLNKSKFKYKILTKTTSGIGIKATASTKKFDTWYLES